jgi:hypothetical protein
MLRIYQNERLAKEGLSSRMPKLRPASAHFSGRLPQVKLKDLKKDKLYRPIDVKTSQLKCRFIDDHPQFVELVREIENFNKKIMKADEKATHIDKYKVKVKFYTQLRKQLQEIVFTKDRPLQKKFLTKVYDWYFNWLDRVERVGPHKGNRGGKDIQGREFPGRQHHVFELPYSSVNYAKDKFLEKYSQQIQLGGGGDRPKTATMQAH